MTDKEKLDAIRAEIHRLVDIRGYDKEMANNLFAFMDSLPNEPVSDSETVEAQNKEVYMKPHSEPIYLGISGIPINAPKYLCKEEPKECMYSKDDFTDEDRKVLCDGCDAECIEKVKEERKRDLSLWSLGDFENNFFEITKPYKDSHNYKNLCIRLEVWRSELWRWIDWKKRKEEPISDDFTKVLAECFLQSQCNGVDPMAHAEIWKDALIKLAKSEEPVSEELKNIELLPESDDEKARKEIIAILKYKYEKYPKAPRYSNVPQLIAWLDKQGEPVSEQNLSNVQRFGKNWKEPVSEDLEEASKEWLRPQLDKSYANYGEKKMMELTHFDGYAMLDAIEFGAQWQKAKDESVTKGLGDYINELSKQFPEVSFAKLSRIAVRVSRWQKEQMMAKAIDGHATFEFYGLDSKTYGTIAHDPICFEDFDIKDSDKVKMVLIKEE